MKSNWVRAILGLLSFFLAISLTLFIHELGHYFVFTALGAKAQMIFIPPFLAVVRTDPIFDKMPTLMKVFGALAGPLANLATAFVIGAVLGDSIQDTWNFIADYFVNFYKVLARPRVFFESIVGPIGLAKELMKEPLLENIFFLGIALGVFNLTPFPPFDGWKTISSAVRLIAPGSWVDFTEQVCSVLLTAFISWVLIKDTVVIVRKE